MAGDGGKYIVPVQKAANARAAPASRPVGYIFRQILAVEDFPNKVSRWTDKADERALERLPGDVSMGSITPLVFTGISQFSDDFQTIINRAVAIAQIPLQELQNEQADLLTKKQLLTDLRLSVADLASVVDRLGRLGETRALSATSSNTSRVTVTLNGATSPGTYTITDITSVATAASETTASGYATDDSTPVSTDGVMELVVGSQTYTIDLTAGGQNNLIGLRDAINGLDAGVSATILNTGAGSTPYYLSITAQNTGATTLQLRETAGDAGSNILTSSNQGSDAVFKLNGLTVTSPENTLTDVIPGLTFTIHQTTDPGESVVLSLSSSRTEVGNALADLVSAYNDLRSRVNLQIGETAGLLSGDFIVREIQQRMRELASFEAAGSIKRLADLGIEFDDQGVMSFNSTKFYSLPESSFNAALDFLGAPTTGFGALSDNFEAISDPVNGLIRTQQDQYDKTDERLSEQISQLTERIDFMQQSLTERLQQADVLLAQLESQQTLLEASLKGLDLAVYGRNDKTN